MSEKTVAGATTTWHDYLQVEGQIIAERFNTVGGSTSWKYFVLDHSGHRQRRRTVRDLGLWHLISAKEIIHRSLKWKAAHR